MRRILIGLVFATAALSAWGQTSDAEWEQCKTGNSGRHIAIDARIDHCTHLIDSWKLTPDQLAEAHEIRGSHYYGKALYALAISDFSQAIELKRDFALAYYRRGLTYDVQTLYLLALADYDRAIALKPDFATTVGVYLTRARTHEKMHNIDKARSDYRMVLKLAPGNADATASLKRLGGAP